ncbi:TRAP transporter substrate-binding protein [Cognatishimia sp. WU-CL00825]|uniref:TRAP transporter substrate-binding protein n=1 Tax=Cognatishimia sp. WU-CL00825 TaxID=3127658 RepID=UPI003108264A
MKNLVKYAAIAAAVVTAPIAQAETLSLAYFMGPNHPMNKAFLTPLGEMIEAETGGEVKVQHFPGGALNASPPNQYSIMLDGVADIVFMLPSFSHRLFPKTSVIGLPNLCETAVDCTEALRSARSELEAEFRGKVVGFWTNSPPVLITKGKPVRSMDDVKGMKIRVSDPTAIPFLEALGASTVAIPVTEINQSLANGIVDGVMIDPSGILSFKLDEPGEYVTTWFPGGPATFAVVMNQDVYDGLNDAGRAAIDRVAESGLSEQAAKTYAAIGGKALAHAKAQGLEVITLSDAERSRIDTVVDQVMADIASDKSGDSTVGDVISLLTGN